MLMMLIIRFIVVLRSEYMKTIEFENGVYELVEETDDTLLFKKLKDYEVYDLKDLASELSCLDEELRYARSEANEYQERIDEFRYCGYNEEDPDFHGMCLHQNHLDKKVDDLETEYNEFLNEIEKRLNNNTEKISELLHEFDIAY